MSRSGKAYDPNEYVLKQKVSFLFPNRMLFINVVNVRLQKNMLERLEKIG